MCSIPLSLTCHKAAHTSGPQQPGSVQSSTKSGCHYSIATRGSQVPFHGPALDPLCRRKVSGWVLPEQLLWASASLGSRPFGATVAMPIQSYEGAMGGNPHAKPLGRPVPGRPGTPRLLFSGHLSSLEASRRVRQIGLRESLLTTLRKIFINSGKSLGCVLPSAFSSTCVFGETQSAIS